MGHIKNGWRWFWPKPLGKTSLFPHHRRWDCRNAIVNAARYVNDDRERARYWLGRADAFNCIMYDCKDPLAYRYLQRINKLRQQLDKGTS